MVLPLSRTRNVCRSEIMPLFNTFQSSSITVAIALKHLDHLDCLDHFDSLGTVTCVAVPLQSLYWALEAHFPLGVDRQTAKLQKQSSWSSDRDNSDRYSSWVALDLTARLATHIYI